MKSCSLNEVVETLRNAKDNNKSCTLLIGAGCSVTAGIPSAKGFVEIITEKFPAKCSTVNEKTYPAIMASLFPEERRMLVQSYINNSKINWAHICIALLLKEGFVDRVLTTNFDPLIVKASALFNEFPAVYDLASSKLVDVETIHGKAVFHLHGQHTGFILINTEEDFTRHSDLIAPVFEDAGKNRVWIVVGYSGQNDPVFNHLSSIKVFKNGLYWIGFQDNEPAKHIADELLVEGKYAHYIKGYNADSFFISLTQELNIFPPKIIHRPFTYLQDIINLFTPFVSDEQNEGQSEDQDVTSKVKEWIGKAISDFEEPEDKFLEVQEYFMAGNYDKVISYENYCEEHQTKDISALVSRAYLRKGNFYIDEFNKTNFPNEEENSLLSAISNYESAIKINPKNDIAYHNLGYASLNIARRKKDTESDSLFQEANIAFQKALELKQNKFATLKNWGESLSIQAQSKPKKESDELFKESYDRFSQALTIKPDYVNALIAWGEALADQARMDFVEGKESLFSESFKKFESAISIDPQSYLTYRKWGDALCSKAEFIENVNESEGIYNLVNEKYKSAISIKQNYYIAYNNWGLALLKQANGYKNNESDKLLLAAIEKFQWALNYKEGYFQSLNNWGYALLERAKLKSGEESEKLFSESCDRIEKAVQISPNPIKMFTFWGESLFKYAELKSGEEAEKMMKMAEEKIEKANILKKNV